MSQIADRCTQATTSEKSSGGRLSNAQLIPIAETPVLTVVFRVFAFLEFVGGSIACVVLWPEEPEAGYAWKTVAYINPLAWLAAGLIFGCLFLAVGEGLKYLNDISRSLRALDRVGVRTTKQDIPQADAGEQSLSEYVSLAGQSGTAFCLGCRKMSPKTELWYKKETDAYYHKECIPR